MTEFTAVTGWTIHKVAAHPETAFKQMEALWEQRNRLMDAKALQEAPQSDLPPFPGKNWYINVMDAEEVKL